MGTQRVVVSANGGTPKVIWGQIKIQDSRFAGALNTGTKFCSDPN
jgi:hypothetical protein